MRKIIFQYCKDMCAGRLARGLDHTNRVYHIAKKLAENYDDEILYAATYLHDVILVEPHQLQSAERAEAILHEVGFNPDKITKVKDAILNHIPEGNPATIEGKMLHDADILDSLGIVGFTRLAIGAFFWRGAKTMDEVLKLVKEYKNRAEKHLILDRAKKISQERIDFMNKALEELEKEISIVDSV